MGIPIVECEYLPFVPTEQHRTIGPAYSHHLLFFQVGERSGAKEPCKIRRNAREAMAKKITALTSSARPRRAPAASSWQAEGIMRADVDKPKSKLKRKAELGSARKHAVPADTAKFSNRLLSGIPGENDLLW